MADFLERVVAFCTRRPWTVVIVSLALALLGGVYAAAHFRINTETTHLISENTQWRQDEIAYNKAFPHLAETIVAVVDGSTPEAADSAAERLVKALDGKPDILRVWRPDANEYLNKEGLLLLDRKDLKARLDGIEQRAPFLGGVAADPTLHGLMTVLGKAMNAAGGSKEKEEQFNQFVAPLGKMANTIDDVLAGKTRQLSWEELFNTEPPKPGDTRRLVLVYPQLDFAALQPGRKPIDQVRKAAVDTGITAEHDLRLRLTGLVPLADEEFATIAENYALNMGGTMLAVAVILYLALRSGKIILAVLATLLAGLAITAGLGLLMIGELNLISVAFAVLFIGLGVDFGVQFSTRYREERYELGELRPSLLSATRHLGRSLTLAAISLVAGFFCFLPTEFHGVSELGLIAGVGMIVAFIATMTFLPALLVVLKPRPESKPIETTSLAAVDHWIEAHRKLVLAITALVVLAGLPFLFKLEFDSNPMHLRSSKVESVSTFEDLAKDPRTAPNTISVIEPDRAAADAVAAKLAALPDVAQVVSLSTFLPADQDAKLALVRQTRSQIVPALDGPKAPAPDDAATVKSIDNVLGMLKIAEEQDAPEPVLHFQRALTALKDASPAKRSDVQTALFANFDFVTGRLKLALSAAKVTEADIPKVLRDDWETADKRYRVQATAKGDSNDNEVMRQFAAAVRTVAPHASGAPITVVEAGHTIVRSFLVAGLLAFVAIFAILYVAMRRVSDVALALGPLVLAGIMSLEAARMFGMSLDFANIIALPLMFGVGVNFHIYYLIAWRNGQTDMLASSLTRAIFFSSLTTGVAFGSLCLSSHPGTAGMGKLLALSLFFTLVAAFLIVPAFLGPPPAKPVKS